MAAGRPIVASDLPAIREVLTAGRERRAGRARQRSGAGRRHPPASLSDPALAARLAAAARRGAGLHLGSARRAARGAADRGRRRALDDLRPTARARALPGVPRGARRATGDARRPAAAAGAHYRAAGRDYLDLRPSVEFAEQTKYLDEALHADARHERVSPPLLGSRIRNDMLRDVPRSRPGATGSSISAAAAAARCCGTRDWRATTVGIDISPFFAEEARAGVDLLLGDLRQLPFADGTFTKACSLDVLEHLSPEALRGMLAEAGARARAGRRAVRLHARPQERADRRRAALDQRPGAPARAPRADRHAPGAAAQVRSPEPAARRAGARAGRRATPASASPGSASTRRSSAASSRTS